jgi:hypothetical protein
MRHLHKTLRMAGLFPALAFLKSQAEKSLRMLPLQPKTQIKILVKDFHLNRHGLGTQVLGTEGIMHPSQDPFAAARLPYLEASPPRLIEPSLIARINEWETHIFS